jgi:hypothetical protein
LITEFNKLRKDALDARSDLTIHREACGIRIKNWERTLRLYPVPAPPQCTCFTSTKVHILTSAGARSLPAALRMRQKLQKQASLYSVPMPRHLYIVHQCRSSKSRHLYSATPAFGCDKRDACFWM